MGRCRYTLFWLRNWWYYNWVRCYPTYLDPPLPDICTCFCGKCLSCEQNCGCFKLRVVHHICLPRNTTGELIRHTLSTQTCTDIRMWWVERSGATSESKAFTWELIRHTLTTQHILISVHVCVLSVCRTSFHVNALLSDADPLLSTHHILISVHVCVERVCRMSSHVNALFSDAVQPHDRHLPQKQVQISGSGGSR
jgi:hypothetical protein